MLRTVQGQDGLLAEAIQWDASKKAWDLLAEWLKYDEWRPGEIGSDSWWLLRNGSASLVNPGFWVVLDNGNLSVLPPEIFNQLYDHV